MRKARAKKRILLPDPVYNDVMVTRFLNNLMFDGKKSIASTLFHDALAIVAKRTNEDGLEVWKKALANVTPQVEVRSRRVGGATYQAPVEVKPNRATTLALRWLIGYSRQRREKTMTERLMNEILDASNGLGAAVKKREDTHKMAEANKAFSHFRF